MKDRRIGTWKERLEDVMATQQDTWEDIEHSSPSIYKKVPQPGSEPPKCIDSDFYIEEDNDGYDQPFLIYTKRWIYFAVLYDGTNWVGSVPRHPIRRFQPEMFGGG